MMRQGKRIGSRAVFPAAAVGLSCALAACTGGSSGGSPGGSANGGTVVIGQLANPDTLNGPDSQSIEATQILALITQTLYQLNPADNGKTIVPDLARSYTLSNRNRTWTFHLRHGVRFSNGQLMTSKDVKFSLLNAKKGTAQGSVDTAIARITTPDRYDVSITTAHPDAAFLSTVSYYSNGIIPSNFGGKPAKAFWNDPIGTGPFKLQSWNYGVSLTLTKNPYYWQPGLPHLTSVVFKPIPDNASRVAGFKAGTLDAIEAPPVAQIAQLKAYPNVEILQTPGAQDDSLYLSAGSGPLSNAKVREALSLVINRRQIARGLLFGAGLPATAPEPLTITMFGPRPPVPAVNVAKARQLLAATPYSHGFTLNIITQGGNAFATSVAQVMQQEFGQLGIKVTISPTDQSEAIADLQKGSYQAMFVPSSSGQTDPDTDAVGVPQYEPSNFKAQFNFPQMEKIALRAEQVFNPAQRERLYERWLALYDQPNDPIPVVYEPLLVAVSKRVHNFLFVQGIYNLTNATVAGG